MSSWEGAYYSILLLDQAINVKEQKAILERGQYSIKTDIKNTHLISIALNHLIIARALFVLNLFEQANNEFNQSVICGYEAGRIDHIPLFLLERAKFHCHQKDFTSSQTDLDEAQEIIDRCGMELYAVDLLRGNLNLDLNKPAQTEYEIAKELIEETCYHLRDKELEELEELEELGKKLGVLNKIIQDLHCP